MESFCGNWIQFQTRSDHVLDCTCRNNTYKASRLLSHYLMTTKQNVAYLSAKNISDERSNISVEFVILHEISNADIRGLPTMWSRKQMANNWISSRWVFQVRPLKANLLNATWWFFNQLEPWWNNYQLPALARYSKGYLWFLSH